MNILSSKDFTVSEGRRKIKYGYRKNTKFTTVFFFFHAKQNETNGSYLTQWHSKGF